MMIYGIGILMLLMTVMMTFIIYQNREGKTANIIFAGFVIRICATIVGYLGILPLFGYTGGDSFMFHGVATYNFLHDGFYIKRTNYSDVLTIIYMLTDGSRLFAQFINVLLSTGVLILTSNTMYKINIPEKTIHNMLKILALMPILTCLSGALLRESWVAFFLALSLYYFVGWFTEGSTNKMILTVLAAFAASYMHAGTIFVLIGFFLAFTSYKPWTREIKFSGFTIVAGIFISLVVVVFLANMGSLGGKFSRMGDDGVEGVMVSGYGANRGDSAYLSWLNVDDPVIGFLFSPLRMFYFLFSPIPFDWRGIMDVIAFSMDSSVYAYLCWKIFKNRKIKNGRMNVALRKYLIASILALTFVFAFGTKNAGTAMRHRAKYTTMFIVTYAISKQVESKKNKKGI